MARITLISETQLNFSYDDDMGVFKAIFSPAPFVLVAGKRYEIIWDGVEFSCIAYTYEAFSESVFMGNTVGLNGVDTGEPFCYGCLLTGEIAEIFTFSAEDTHTIAIYQEEVGEVDSEAIILKNREGVDIAYSGIDTVKFNKAGGGTQTFIRGEVVEDMPIEADFSEGDQIVEAPSGTLVKSAIIQKPENLIPQNIAEGVNIAGVLGSLAPEGGDLLPEINGEHDNSKLLAVIDGKWQKANYENVIPKARLVPSMMTGNNGKVLGVRGLSWEVMKFPLAWSRFEGVPFGKLKTVFEEREITLNPTSEGSKLIEYRTDDDITEPVEGEAYKVKWGDSEYVCTAQDLQKAFDEKGYDVQINNACQYLGNLYLWLGNDFADTGEPFLYLSQMYLGQSSFLAIGSTTTLTVSISPVNSFKKIPKEYLPDVGAALPEVTEADNGKVLGVVGGKWRATVPTGGTMVEIDKTVSYDFAVQGVPSVSVPFPLMNVTLHKVSIETPSLEELHGAKFVSNYAPGVYAGANVEIDTSMAMISTPDLFISQDCPDGPNGEYGQYSFAVVYKTGEIAFDLMGTQVTVNSPSTGIYLIFTYGQTPPANWQFSLTYKTKVLAGGGRMGGVVSWNNLTDKPFYKYEKATRIDSDSIQNISFPGFGFNWTKVSDEILTKDELIGANISAYENGIPMGGAMITEDSVAFADERGTALLIGYAFALFACYIPGTYNVFIPMLGEEDTITIPEAGLYVPLEMLSGMPENEYYELVSENTKKIDDEYQHQTDWDETVEEKAGYLKNRPFGKLIGDDEVVTDATVRYDGADTWFMLFDMNAGTFLADTSKIIVGASYSLTIGETVLEGKGVTEEHITNILGDTFGNGIEAYVNGLPSVFLVTSVLGTGVPAVLITDFGIAETLGLVDETEYAIKCVSKESIKPLDQKYIPSPPEFDLAAMGLPTLSMEQMYVGKLCDASELCAALDKDVVKISFKVDFGGEMPVTGIVNAMVLGGTYSCGFVGKFQDMPLLINFMIEMDRIDASITILGTASI